MKRWIIKISFVGILVVLGILLFFFGRQHDAIIEYGDITVNETTYSIGEDLYIVKIDNENIEVQNKKSAFSRSTSTVKSTKIVGPNHSIEVYKGDDPDTLIRKETFSVGINNNSKIILVSFINGMDDWYSQEQIVYE